MGKIIVNVHCMLSSVRCTLCERTQWTTLVHTVHYIGLCVIIKASTVSHRIFTRKFRPWSFLNGFFTLYVFLFFADRKMFIGGLSWQTETGKVSHSFFLT